LKKITRKLGLIALWTDAGSFMNNKETSRKEIER
jgi:hypothetical protein